MHTKKTLIKPALPLTFSLLTLLILLSGLSQATQAQPRAADLQTQRQARHPSSPEYLTGIPVCEQTENLPPNPSFEQITTIPLHWHASGPCVFVYDDPGPDSAVAAQIFASARAEGCMLFTDIPAIPVEPGRFYDYSAQVQADLAQGNAYLHITFWSGTPGNWAFEGDAYTAPVTDTQNAWVKATGSVQAPAGAEYARMEATLPGDSSGSVWFDDVFFGLATCLDISKSDDPDPVLLGETLTYTIVYSNVGREKATNVTIIETYDKYVDFVAAQPAPDISTNLWLTPELSPAVSHTIQVQVQVENDTEDHAWLFNDVQIRSDETAPVDFTIATNVPVTGCVIDLLLPEDDKTGAPGEQVDYDLTLRNAGSCHGQVNWETFSSLGWDVITPGLILDLTPGASLDVQVSPIVSRYALSDTVNVTSITATLGCELPCGGTTAIATATATTRVSAVPLAGIVISGPTAGDVDTDYTFTAATSPITATQPITYLWQITGREGIVALADAPTHTITLSWHVSDTYTIAVTATNAGRVERSAVHTIVISGTFQANIYLPLLASDWPPIPNSPELYPIDNADGDGSYTIQWSAGSPGTVGTQLIPPTYELEEATDAYFSTAVQVYSGPDTGYTVSGQGPGRYYYRVRTCNSWMCSDWSNVEWVDVQ